jgi:hypothetical protein
MQSVSAAWLANQAKSITTASNIEVIYDVRDSDMGVPVYTDNGHMTISDITKLDDATDYTVTKYATMEKGLALLDGTFDIIPDAAPYGYNSYASLLASDVSGEFTTDPLITLTFPAVTTSRVQVVTVKWSTTYNEYADSFTIRVYDTTGAGLLETEVVTGNTDITSETLIDLSNDYNVITVEVNEWATPHHRARIEKLFVGAQEIYTNSDLKRFSIERRCGIFAETTPTLRLNIGVDNTDGKFDPYDPSSATSWILDRQSLLATIGFDIGSSTEEISGGQYYMSQWSNLTNRNMATFQADGLGYLLKDTYKRGVLVPSGTTLLALAEAVAADAGLTSAQYSFDASLGSVSSTAPLGLHTHEECFQLIANAGECIFYYSMSNMVVIKPKVASVQDYEVKTFNELKSPDLEYIEPVSTLDVKVHNYSVDDTKSIVYEKDITVSGTETLKIGWQDAVANAYASLNGIESIFNDSSTGEIEILKVYGSDTKFITMFNTANGTAYLAPFVADGVNINFGNKTQLADANVSRFRATFFSATSFIVIYEKDGVYYRARIGALSSDGLDISLNDEIASSYGGRSISAFNSTQFVAALRYTTGRCVIGTVNVAGNSLVYGLEYVYEATGEPLAEDVHALSPTTFAVVYNMAGRVSARIGTVTGSVIGYGTRYNTRTADTTTSIISALLTTSRIAIAAHDDDTADSVQGIMLNISAGFITFSSDYLAFIGLPVVYDITRVSDTVFGITSVSSGECELKLGTWDSSDIAYGEVIGFGTDVSAVTISGTADSRIAINYVDRAQNYYGRTFITDFELNIPSGDFYARYAEFEVGGTGTAKLYIRGNNINDSTTSIIIDNSEDGREYKNNNELIDDATHATSVGEWINDILSDRKKITLRFRCDPRLDIADTIKHITTYVTEDVFVSDFKLDFKGSWIATVEGVVL